MTTLDVLDFRVVPDTYSSSHFPSIKPERKARERAFFD